MDDDEYEIERSRRNKEFVYDQWRKILTLFVIGDDISRNDFTPKNVTSEKIRTVFNNGYKLAMLQTKQSLMNEMYKTGDEQCLKIIEKILDQIDDRLETQKCFVTYKGWSDQTVLEEALIREDEFIISSDMAEWAGEKM